MITPELTDAVWRKSSHSGSDEGSCVEVASVWRKSTHSGGDEGACVEVARTDRLVAVHDSKNPTGPVLAFAPTEWHALLTVIKTGIPPTR
jgi:Domain of unknown function (DUF397)